jgi:hypothetical protein
MGVVEEVETKEDGVDWGEYLLVKVKIDLTKPVGDVCLMWSNMTWGSRLPKEEHEEGARCNISI